MELAWGLGAIFAAALVQGATGFGIALVAVPVLMLFLDPVLVPPVMVLLSLLNNLLVLVRAHPAIKPGLITPLILSGVAGLPLGAWLLRALDPGAIKLGVGVAVVLMAALMFLGWRKDVRRQLAGLLSVGLLGGVLHTSTSVSGPPVILFLANQGVDKDEFRANLIAYFAVLNATSILVFACFGLLPAAVWLRFLTYLPALVLGSLTGIWLAGRIPQQAFRTLVLALVAVLGVALIASSLRAMM